MKSQRLFRFLLLFLMLALFLPLTAADKKSKKDQDPVLTKLKKQQQLLKLQNSIAVEILKKKMSKLSFAKKLLVLENQILREKNTKISIKMQIKSSQLKQELLEIKLRISRLNMESTKSRAALSRLKTDLAMRKSKEQWDIEVNKKPAYTLHPFYKGTLQISDRRIPLNGPIIRGVANYITRRIHYFNNKSTRHPIFIVIDVCPGGSVMEGYRIVKAMQASKAPIYVVVKSFAASMAAVITTLAKKSFAYPNAVILHHQMSTVNWGNMTELKEQLANARKWEKRLMVPVARKMGISVKKFVRQMYKNNSRGDWEEFADRAQKLKWVNKVVQRIREQSIIKKPNEKSPKRRRYFFLSKGEQRDVQGRRYIELPRLTPYDFYFIYNPDRYYR